MAKLGEINCKLAHRHQAFWSSLPVLSECHAADEQSLFHPISLTAKFDVDCLPCYLMLRQHLFLDG